MIRHHEFTPDRFTRLILSSIAALLAVIAAELWAGLPAGTTCIAQIPDSGRQRLDLLVEARRSNELLSEILEQLKEGTVKVEFAATDKHKAGDSRRTEPRPGTEPRPVVGVRKGGS